VRTSRAVHRELGEIQREIAESIHREITEIWEIIHTKTIHREITEIREIHTKTIHREITGIREIAIGWRLHKRCLGRRPRPNARSGIRRTYARRMLLPDLLISL
jgi:hypothetical protein